MPVGLNETPGMFVDPACPVNWEHPLNRGLVSWWNAVPNSGWIGSKNFVDAVSRVRTGTLGSGLTWSKPVFGNRSVLFNGSAKVSVPVAVSGTVLTISFWMNYTNAADAVVIGGADNGGSGADYAPYIDSPSGNIYYRPGGSGAGAVFATVAHGGLTSGTFYHMAIVRNGTSVSFYKNGAQLSTTQTMSANGTGSINTFGSYSGGTLPFSGNLSSIKYHSVALGATQIKALFLEARRGNPETLRWVGSKTYGFAQAAAPATGNPWYQYAQQSAAQAAMTMGS